MTEPERETKDLRDALSPGAAVLGGGVEYTLLERELPDGVAAKLLTRDRRRAASPTDGSERSRPAQ